MKVSCKLICITLHLIIWGRETGVIKQQFTLELKLLHTRTHIHAHAHQGTETDTYIQKLQTYVYARTCKRARACR